MMYRTERLLVRHLTAADLDSMVAVYGDPDAMRFVDDGQPLDRARCAEWVTVTENNYAERGYGMSAIDFIETGETIGFMGIVHPGGRPAELKYSLRREFWNLGLATEAARGMVAYGNRVFGMKRILATADPANRASHNVLTKIGMTRQPDLEAKQPGTLFFLWEAEGQQHEE